ncbi:MAG TPA: hypothetical protein QF621_04420, partial [Candidatus Thalassarchaeaceae archaeon]|nr:hypothetical protein [Candidatus Thalassarchaeaceae archaeon]
VKARSMLRRRYRLECDTINIPVQFLARTSPRLDEIILSRTFEKLMGLPSYLKLNSGEILEDDFEEEE